ncbi:LmeA family phospholipid-binding protein [Corynebacterium sp. H113]|uniref:LmeA family phospholipid-binding protein n=1 Tax=Corynebacterium sp. H113 TaxID=3133419 RepID=UPI0030A684F6
MNAKQRKSSGCGCLGTILGIVIVVALIAVAAEFGMRFIITKQINDTYDQLNSNRQVTATDNLAISYGTSPVLPVLVTDEIPHMTIKTPATLEINDRAAAAGGPEIIGEPASTVEMDNLNVANRNNPVAGTMVITSELSPELIQAIANRRSTDLARISSLTPNTAEGVFDAEFTSGLVKAQFRPVVRDGGLGMDIEGASVFGIEVGGVAQTLGDAALQGLTAPIGHGLVADDATVTDAGLLLRLRGENLPLSTMRDIEYR